ARSLVRAVVSRSRGAEVLLRLDCRPVRRVGRSAIGKNLGRVGEAKSLQTSAHLLPVDLLVTFFLQRFLQAQPYTPPFHTGWVLRGRPQKTAANGTPTRELSQARSEPTALRDFDAAIFRAKSRVVKRPIGMEAAHDGQLD